MLDIAYFIGEKLLRMLRVNIWPASDKKKTGDTKN